MNSLFINLFPNGVGRMAHANEFEPSDHYTGVAPRDWCIAAHEAAVHRMSSIPAQGKMIPKQQGKVLSSVTTLTVTTAVHSGFQTPLP